MSKSTEQKAIATMKKNAKKAAKQTRKDGVPRYNITATYPIHSELLEASPSNEAVVNKLSVKAYKVGTVVDKLIYKAALPQRKFLKKLDRMGFDIPPDAVVYAPQITITVVHPVAQPVPGVFRDDGMTSSIDGRPDLEADLERADSLSDR